MRLTKLEKIIFLLVIGIGFIISINKSVSNKTVESARSMGLTFEEFIKAYNKVADEYYGDRLDKKTFQSRNKGDRKILYVYNGNHTTIDFELYGRTEYLSKITVFSEPIGRQEEEIIKQAGSIYIKAIMAASPDFTLNDALGIMNKLSLNLKYSSVTLKGFEFTVGVFDGVLIFSIRAAS